MKRMLIVAAALPVSLLGLTGSAGVLAQGYPAKPLRIVLGFPPGGGTDTVARLVGPRLSELLGQPVVIDNRPGADTNIANEYSAHATPDGYTLLLTTGALTINMSFYSKVDYDAIRDFTPLSLIATSPHVLVVGPGLPIKTLKELIDAARSRPGQLNYSSSGGPQLVAAELFKLRTHTDIVRVSYKGGGPALTALLGGEVQLSFSNIPTVMPFSKSGRLRALAVSSAARSVLMPEVPTIKEQGVDVETAVWYGLLAPSATPVAVVSKLSDAMARVTRAEDVRQRLLGVGVEPLGGGPEAFAKQLRLEVKQWAEVARLVGMKLN